MGAEKKEVKRRRAKWETGDSAFQNSAWRQARPPLASGPSVPEVPTSGSFDSPECQQPEKLLQTKPSPLRSWAAGN